MGKSSVYYAERAQARDAAFKYVNNPFPEGTRIARFFEKAKKHNAAIDAAFDDMEEVYGVFATKRPIIDNVPGTFRNKNSKRSLALKKKADLEANHA